jgi:hypothetical protein
MLRSWPDARDAAVTTRDRARQANVGASGPAPLTPAEQRGAFAAILLAAAAPVQLTILAEMLGIPSRPRSLWDVALVADASADIDRILAQSWRPRELVTTEQLPDRGRAALAEAGIDVMLVDSVVLSDPAMLGVRSPFIAEQVDLTNVHDIAELLAGQLLGQPGRAHPTDARLAVPR